MNTKSGRLGKYEMQQRLAQGGMGEVWLANDPWLQRPCALKVIDPERAGLRQRGEPWPDPGSG